MVLSVSFQNLIRLEKDDMIFREKVLSKME